ncbi:MAG: hypothetical protein ACI9BD_000161 [Candidatus Marinamargulisbacteria bacterium]|jgi:hypothetical protein
MNHFLTFNHKAIAFKEAESVSQTAPLGAVQPRPDVDLYNFIASGTDLLHVDMSHIHFSAQRVAEEPKRQNVSRRSLDSSIENYPENAITRQFIQALEQQHPDFVGRDYSFSTHRTGLISESGIAISDGSNHWHTDQENNGRPHLIYSSNAEHRTQAISLKDSQILKKERAAMLDLLSKDEPAALKLYEKWQRKLDQLPFAQNSPQTLLRLDNDAQYHRKGTCGSFTVGEPRYVISIYFIFDGKC